VEYSWWRYMMKARERNVGWRIDYFLVSDRIFGSVRDSIIHTDVMGSDHCPVEIDIEI
jgi:exodeoxyribonuclease-3